MDAVEFLHIAHAIGFDPSCSLLKIPEVLGI
jgi:hypothetical protein